MIIRYYVSIYYYNYINKKRKKIEKMPLSVEINKILMKF